MSKAIRADILAQIAALQDQLAGIPEYVVETVPVDFFVHDGSDARPEHIPDDVRVLYFHLDDNAFVVTNSNKLRSWAKVTKYIFFTKEKFRTFAKSKSRYAI